MRIEQEYAATLNDWLKSNLDVKAQAKDDSSWGQIQYQETGPVKSDIIWGELQCQETSVVSPVKSDIIWGNLSV